MATLRRARVDGVVARHRIPSRRRGWGCALVTIGIVAGLVTVALFATEVLRHLIGSVAHLV